MAFKFEKLESWLREPSPIYDINLDDSMLFG
jgi:hypothetical protein